MTANEKLMKYSSLKHSKWFYHLFWLKYHHLRYRYDTYDWHWTDIYESERTSQKQLFLVGGTKCLSKGNLAILHKKWD